MTRDITADRLRRQSEAARHLIAEIQSDDDALNHDMVEGETGLMEAIDAALAEIDETDMVIDGCQAKIDTLQARGGAAKRRQERLRSLIEQAMLVAELPSVKRPTATLSVAQRKPKLIVTDEAAIPSKFWRQPDPVVDKRALNAAADAGEAIPGTTMSNGSTSLTIRRK